MASRVADGAFGLALVSAATRQCGGAQEDCRVLHAGASRLRGNGITRSGGNVGFEPSCDYGGELQPRHEWGLACMCELRVFDGTVGLLGRVLGLRG